MSSQNETDHKRRKYIEYRTLGGMNKKDAALAAGFSSSMASNVAAKIENPEVLEAVENLQKALLTEIPTSLLVQKFHEGLDSKIHKVIQHNGEVKDILEFDDHPTILRYLEKIALISRRYQPKTITEHTGKDGGPIELSALSNEELEQRRQWLERELGILPPDSPPGRTLPPPPGGAKKGGV